MNLVIPIIAVIGGVLGLAVAAPFSESIRRQLVRASVIVGWLGVLGGALGIYFGELSGLGTLIGTAACGGLAILPLGMKLRAGRIFAAPIGAALPLVAGALGLALQVDIAGGNSGALILYAGHWGTLAAALVAALVASALASSEGWGADAGRKTPGMSLGLATAALTGGAYLIGGLRGGPEGTGWSLPLASDAGGVTWQVPASAGLPQGLWLDVVAELGWMGPLLIAGAAVSLLTAAATRFDAGRRASALGWFVGAAASLAGFVGLLTSRTNVQLPDAAAYKNTASTLLGDVEGAKMLLEQGRFVTEGDLFVPLGAIAPELVMLGVATVVGALAGAFALKSCWPGDAGDEPRRTAMALHARDYALRAIILGWLSWLLVTLIHWSHFGAVGAGSPAEWNAVGILAAATGLLLVSWTRRNSRLDGFVREVVPGLIFALLIVGVAAGVVFDAPFGLSIVF